MPRKVTASITRQRPLTFWPHTGIEAPTTLGYRRYEGIPNGRGIAFTADLVHPELGTIGQLVNEGVGGGTRFEPISYEKFGLREMRAYVSQCRQDGSPLLPLGEESLFNAVFAEQDTADEVRVMRRRHTSLVRQFAPTTPGGVLSWRGDVTHLAGLRALRADRERAARELTDQPEAQSRFGGEWQMFNGRCWTPLLLPWSVTEEEKRERIKAIRRRDHVIDALYNSNKLHGIRRQDYLLVGDEGLVNLATWCQCETGPRARLARFECWNNKDGFLASGQLHAKRGCRNLVTVN